MTNDISALQAGHRAILCSQGERILQVLLAPSPFLVASLPLESPLQTSSPLIHAVRTEASTAPTRKASASFTTTWSCSLATWRRNGYNRLISKSGSTKTASKSKFVFQIILIFGPHHLAVPDSWSAPHRLLLLPCLWSGSEKAPRAAQV